MIERREFDDWTDFVTNLDKVVSVGFHGTPITRLAFRGQSDSSWPLTSSLDRSILGTGLNAEEVQACMLDDYRRRVRTDRNGLTTEDLTLGHLQHYGAPTRLLDWTRSPYIATFFALAPGRSSTDWASVWMIDPTARPFTEGSGLLFLDMAVSANKRARAQMGCFTRLSSLASSIEDHLTEYARTRGGLPRPVGARWDIACSVSQTALHQLSLMGTSFATLFPDATGVARESFHQAVRATRAQTA